MTASDIESLQPRTRSGGRCLPAFLITSMITLFVLLAGVTFTAALFIRQLQTELANLTKTTHEQTGPSAQLSESQYKVQNFAFLRASSGVLNNVTMEWKNRSLETVGSGYTFSDVQHTLQPQAEGSYLLYLDLVLLCRDPPCSAINGTVVVKSEREQLLECQFSAPQRRTEKCWQVVRVDKAHRLVAVMSVRGATDKWELDTEKSGMGMFLVDGQTR
ncbi:hypothetical protein COCON_G00206950 [Conger conger]|uniref:TNF family profile domain-containing protein n=1 Tax=Conger conger TaxID=82655 RepID=A0A9Q1CZZ8_CONCO|nr:uncharacterized protein LOC133115108 [Conger conger]KAJ8254083.1 hypothetical protein COCON_G00206950 [Conger conger]